MSLLIGKFYSTSIDYVYNFKFFYDGNDGDLDFIYFLSILSIFLGSN
jgi:hypothetical protein